MKEMENDGIKPICPIAYAAMMSNFEKMVDVSVWASMDIRALVQCGEDCAWYNKETGRCAVFLIGAGNGEGKSRT